MGNVWDKDKAEQETGVSFDKDSVLYMQTFDFEDYVVVVESDDEKFTVEDDSTGEQWEYFYDEIPGGNIEVLPLDAVGNTDDDDFIGDQDPYGDDEPDHDEYGDY